MPKTIVMSTRDCVDASLAGLDRAERVNASSLQDEARLRAYETDTAALLRAMFDARPSDRYGLGGKA